MCHKQRTGTNHVTIYRFETVDGYGVYYDCLDGVDMSPKRHPSPFSDIGLCEFDIL